jgi:hypothetical protein
MSAIVIESTVSCVLEILGGKMFVVRVSKVIHEDQADYAVREEVVNTDCVVVIDSGKAKGMMFLR